MHLGSQFQPWQEGVTELMAVGIWQSSLHTLGDPFLSSRPGPKGFITSKTVSPAGDLRACGGTFHFQTITKKGEVRRKQRERTGWGGKRNQQKKRKATGEGRRGG